MNMVNVVILVAVLEAAVLGIILAKTKSASQWVANLMGGLFCIGMSGFIIAQIASAMK